MGESFKTGQPINSAGKSGTDLKHLIPGLAANVGIEDIGGAVAFFKKNRGVIGALLGFLGLGGPKADKPTPAPAPSAPAPAGEPSTPAGDPTTSRRRVASLRSRWFLIERKNNPGQQGGGRHIIGKAEFDAITSGGDPARLGDRLHIDTTPIDQFGQPFQPGGEENRALLMDPNDPRGADGASRITHRINGDGELTSEYDDYGCTPVVLIPWEGRDNDSDRESEVSYQAVYNGPDGARIEGNVLPTIRIKA